jgi:hypothetical protein
MAGNGRHAADHLLVLGLARGLTVQAAAVEAGVSMRTATRRMADPGFARSVAEARASLAERAIGVLSDRAADAATVLAEIAADPGAPPQARVAAARAILQTLVQRRQFAGFTVSEFEWLVDVVLGLAWSALPDEESRQAFAMGTRARLAAVT